jgi:3-hydroxyisobutyrate dehydrogenase
LRPTIALLGTGSMGAPIAGNLLAEGFGVAVWNRTPAKAEPLGDEGARLASSPADAAKGAEVLLTMLADGGAVNEVMTGPGSPLETLAPGSVWIQMSTVGVAWTTRFADLASAHRLEFVDAPVSGSVGPAREGGLLVLASGLDEVRASLQGVFDAIGHKTLWLGPAGTGTRLKLVLNNWLAAQVEAVAETIALTDALGLDPHLFPETIADGPLASAYALAKAEGMIAGEFDAGFALRLASKDVGLALDAAEAQGLDLPLTSAVARRWEEAIAAGHADDDVSSVVATARVRTRVGHGG